MEEYRTAHEPLGDSRGAASRRKRFELDEPGNAGDTYESGSYCDRSGSRRETRRPRFSRGSRRKFGYGRWRMDQRQWGSLTGILGPSKCKVDFRELGFNGNRQGARRLGGEGSRRDGRPSRVSSAGTRSRLAPSFELRHKNCRAANKGEACTQTRERHGFQEAFDVCDSSQNMTGLKVKPKEHCRWDLVSLGEVMLRLDPGDRRINTTRRFQVWEGRR